MTPCEISVLLHFYVSPLPHERHDAPAVSAAIRWFLDVEAIRRGDTPNTYVTTPLGKAWVEALCRVPKPRLAYLDEQNRVLLRVSDGDQ